MVVVVVAAVRMVVGMMPCTGESSPSLTLSVLALGQLTRQSKAGPVSGRAGPTVRPSAASGPTCYPV